MPGARASVAEMVELAQAARYRTGTVSYEKQRAILRRLDRYCIAAGYNLNGKVGKWNNAYGAVVEGMLLPTGAVLKKGVLPAATWRPRHRSEERHPAEQGRRHPARPMAGGQLRGYSGRDQGQPDPRDPGRPTGYARQHLKNTRGDSGNITPGSQIHYFHIPAEQVMQQMIVIFGAAGSPISRVRSGDGDWTTIHPAPGP